jgi:hypothetical protein
MKSAAALDAALDAGRGIVAAADTGAGPRGGRGAKGKAAKGKAAKVVEADDAATAEGAGGDSAAPETDGGTPDAGAGAEAAPAKLAAADRRSAAATLIGVWASVARDIAVAAAGGAGQIREIALLDELPGLAPAVAARSLAAFLAQLAEISIQLDDNVNPELALDVLALSWPHIETAASAGAGARGGAGASRGAAAGTVPSAAPPRR